MPRTPSRGPCPHCVHHPRLTADGTLARHWNPDANEPAGPCPGSGENPAPTRVVSPLAEPDPIGGLLTARRVELGLLQRDVAALIGCHTQHYGHIERGAVSPTLRTLRRACAALHLHLDVASDGQVTQLRAQARDAKQVAGLLRAEIQTHLATIADLRRHIVAANAAAAAAQERLEAVAARADAAEAVAAAATARAAAARRQALGVLAALARQPVLTHDLIEQAQAAIAGRDERRAA